ncbi:UNVERIFIED_CONTAM: Monooxygenase 2 [Sesamum radiatum]|uniref:Monooxygenase 2 n=1 Tax=Sesamum radiatum TaxID=300843 RepID=A0AAW2S2T0_SESRA
MEKSVEDVVIVGAGIAGLATALGLHRLGIRSLVLESGDSMRTSGFALGIWTNGWRALDALGVGDILRSKHKRITGIITTSVISGLTTSQLPFTAMHSGIITTSVNSGLTTSQLPFTAIHSWGRGDHELRAVNRKVLLETLETELPKGIIRFSSKVVRIETDHHHHFNSIHLADGTVLQSKVLIGCDGVNSVVARFLGFSKPSFAGRSAVRGLVDFENGHGFEPKFRQFFGKGIRYGVIPCDDVLLLPRVLFCSFVLKNLLLKFRFLSISIVTYDAEREVEEDPTKLKQFILSKLGKVSDNIRAVFEKTQVQNMVCSPLRFRLPWELLWRNISKDNVCIAGDALHPMTPDLGQGGCAALEDSIVLAGVLAEALKGKASENEYQRLQKGLEKFARERRWRSFDLISTAYMVGFMQQSDGVVMNFVRDKIVVKFMAGMLLKKAGFDCGKLTVSS